MTICPLPTPVRGRLIVRLYTTDRFVVWRFRDTDQIAAADRVVSPPWAVLRLACLLSANVILYQDSLFLLATDNLLPIAMTSAPSSLGGSDDKLRAVSVMNAEGIVFAISSEVDS